MDVAAVGRGVGGSVAGGCLGEVSLHVYVLMTTVLTFLYEIDALGMVLEILLVTCE